MILFIYGIVATSVLTDVLKVSVGMLRPNFLAICQPNVSCTSREDFGIYHTDYVCQVCQIARSRNFTKVSLLHNVNEYMKGRIRLGCFEL